MGIKDHAYASLFDKKDLPYLYRFAEKVRATHDPSLVDDFNQNCQKKVNDHNPVLHVGNKDVEFLQVSKADDLMVDAGIDQCIKLIQGTSAVVFRYMAAGTGSTAPLSTQTALTTYSTNADMSLFGWREYAGPTLRFAGVFGESLATVTINESGVFTAAGGTGTMLNRNMFSLLPIAHTVNVTGFVISSVIEFVPVMS